MGNRLKNVILLIGLILIVSTAALFFILTENRVLIDWLGFGFILLAELLPVLSLVIIINKKNQPENIIRIGLFSITGLYAIVSIIVSISFMLYLRTAVKLLITFHVISLMITLILAIIIFISAAFVGNKNKSVLQSVYKMQELLNQITLIRSRFGNSSVGPKLNKIYEAIRYCDVSATVASDEIVALKLAELDNLLEDGSEESLKTAEKSVDSILELMVQRTAELTLIKSGGI